MVFLEKKMILNYDFIMEKIMNENMPIGFMDSGLGGLSVLREAMKIMPKEDFIYYGDSAHAPYGTKPRDEIRKYVFEIVEYLVNRGIKGLAIACNTATGAAVADLRKMYPSLPLVGIEPAIKPAVERYKGGRILVMATPMTIRQDKFKALLSKYEDRAEIVPVPCEGLMEFVENGTSDIVDLNKYFSSHLSPYLTPNTESILLGCTHYPFLKDNLNEFLAGRNISLIDGSFGTARELQRRIDEIGLLREPDYESIKLIRLSKDGSDLPNAPLKEIYEGNLEIINSSSDPGKIDLSRKLLELD